MSEETPDQSSDQPEIWSPIQPSGSDTPFMSEEPTEAPAAPGFAAPVAPTAPPVAPSYIDVAKRRSLFELWGATFQALKGNFSPIIQISALISTVMTLLQVAVVVALFFTIPDAGNYLKDISSGEFTMLTSSQVDGTTPMTLNNDQIVGLLVTVGLGVVALFLMTFVAYGIFWVFVEPRPADAEPLTFAEVRSAFFKSLPRMLSATFMWAIRALGVVAVIAALLAVTYFAPGDLTWLAVVVLIAGFGFLLWYSISVTFVAYVVQSTSLSGNQSVRRSVELVRGAWWRTVWVLMATNIVVSMFASAISGLVPMPTAALDSTGSIPWAFVALFAASTFISSLISLPLTAITIANYYRDRSGS